MPEEQVVVAFNMMWVVMGLILVAGIVGLIAWFKSGMGSIGCLALGTLLIGVSLLLQILGINVEVLVYIVWFAAPVLFIIGFILAMKK